MPTEKIYNELKGEHFHTNNADMELDFAKPSQAEINEMTYNITWMSKVKDLPNDSASISKNEE